jgi:HEAT repeat protein
VARSALTAADAAVRATALTALHRLGLLSDEDISAALGDPEGVVRQRAAYLAAGRPNVDLLKALGDPEWQVAETAAWACGEQGEVAVLDETVFTCLVATATEHTDALVREAAIASLGAIGDERGLPAILAGTHDKPAIRRRAIIALTPFDGPEVTEALERAASDHDWQVRDAATDLA